MGLDTNDNHGSSEADMLRRIQQLTEEPTMEGSTDSHYIPIAELVKVHDGQVHPYRPSQPGHTDTTLRGRRGTARGSKGRRRPSLRRAEGSVRHQKLGSWRSVTSGLTYP
ncbi:hypothetical protein EV126DRAFT_431811 [Verticillium dahliae]|nr:hypothetical protein EV126DRAFT_431811 [Verticillium dahliae]